MAPEEDEDDILGAEYDRREFREMCELFGFDVSPPGTPEAPAAAPTPAPAAPPAPDDAAEISEEEARAYWAARDRAGGAATDEKSLCRARARGAIAPVERTELGLAKDQRVVVLRAELTKSGWVFAAAYDGASGYVPRSYLKPVSAAPTPAAESGAARRARAFADFEAEARARYLEEFSRLATTDDVIGYAWPKPELGPDGLPLPLATRGGAATAPVPERADVDAPSALLGSHDRRRAHAETRRRALAARSRGVFRTGRSSHRGPLMPSIDKIKPLPPRPRDPFAPPRFAVTDVDGSRYELSSRAATSVSHQGGSDAEAAFAREVARDADVETFFDRSIVEAARARPMRGAPRGRQRYNSPYSRRVGPRLRPLEGGGTASVARALASTASAGARSVTSALTVDDFSVA